MTTSEPRWLQLLRAEAERTSIAAIAVRLGYSRTSISLVLAGKYPVAPDRIAQAAIALLEVVVCPHAGQTLPLTECRSTALGAAPTHHPMKLSHWRACQRCPNRPQGD